MHDGINNPVDSENNTDSWKQFCVWTE